MIIGIDGDFVKGRPLTDRANLEIITGRIEADAEPSKVFPVVRDPGWPKGTFRRFCSKVDEALRPSCVPSLMARTA